MRESLSSALGGPDSGSSGIPGARSLIVLLSLAVGCVGSDADDDGNEDVEVPENTAPVVTTPDDATVEVGDVFEVLLEASDPEDDQLTFAIDQGPAAAAITGRLVQWAPTVDDVGVAVFQVSVTDDAESPLSTVVSFAVTVEEPPAENQAPVATPVTERNLRVDETLDITFTATDPDGDELTWSSDSLPGNATLTPEGAFSFTPVVGDEGTFTVTATVTDDGVPPLSDNVVFDVNVEPRIPEYDVTGTATDLGFPPTELANLCVDLLDITPIISGGSPIVLDSTVTNLSGGFSFADVTVKPTLGLVVQLTDCNSTGLLGIITSNWVTNDVYAGAADGDVVTYNPVGLSPGLLNAMNVSAADLGYLGDLTQGGFLFGIAFDGSMMPSLPASGVSVDCSNCSGASFFYLDSDPGDGVFTTNGVANTETDITGLFVIADAPISQYDITSDALTFQPVLTGGFPGQAVFVPVTGL